MRALRIEPTRTTQDRGSLLSPEYKKSSSYPYPQPGEAPTLPDPSAWFTDVFMVCRTATVMGKRVQVRAEDDKLIVEVEK